MPVTRREFMLGAAASVLPGAAGADAQTADRAWLENRSRIYFYDQYALNEQASAFAKYDPDRITEELVGTGADIIVIYAANQFSIAYYPSRVWPQHPNLKGRDYVGDLVSRLRKRGKKVAAYINWLESRHADWNTIPLGKENDPELREFPLVNWADPNDPERRVQKVPGGKWRFPCINSPRRQQIVSVTREIVDRYHPDAFCLDMYHANFGTCVCRFCRPTVAKICGTQALTMEVLKKNWREYIDWKLERSASLLDEITAILRPKGVVSLHNSGAPLPLPVTGGSGELWMPHLDVLLLEAFSNLDITTLTARTARAVNKPGWQLLTSTYPRHAHTSIPPAWWRATAASCKANNVAVLGPCGTGAFPDTTTSKELLRNVSGAFERFVQDADLHPGAQSRAKVALVFSWANRKYFHPTTIDAREELIGWSQMLLSEHIPFDLVVAERIKSAADLAQYDLVILPNTAFLSDSFCSAVKDHVRGGGHLLASGEASLGDEKGFRRKDFALSGVLGVSWRGGYTGQFAMEAEGEPRPATATLQQVEAGGKVAFRALDIDPAGSVNGTNDPMPVIAPNATPRASHPGNWPLVVTNQTGKGRSVYLAMDAGTFYNTTGLPYIAEYVARAIDSLVPRQMKVKAPYAVEVTVYAQQRPERTIIHLANRSQSPNNLARISELIPIPGIQIEIASPYPKSEVTCRRAGVQTRNERGNLIMKIDSLDDYAALVISRV